MYTLGRPHSNVWSAVFCWNSRMGVNPAQPRARTQCRHPPKTMAGLVLKNRRSYITRLLTGSRLRLHGVASRISALLSSCSFCLQHRSTHGGDMHAKMVSDFLHRISSALVSGNHCRVSVAVLFRIGRQRFCKSFALGF